MNSLDLNAMGVQEMNTSEMIQADGGNPWAFVAGAIIGGMIYDAYKAVAFAIIEFQIENPDTIIIGSQR